MLVATHDDDFAACRHRHDDGEIRQYHPIKIIDDSFTGKLHLLSINAQPWQGAEHQLLLENFPRLNDRHVLSGHRLSCAEGGVTSRAPFLGGCPHLLSRCGLGSETKMPAERLLQLAKDRARQP